MLRAALDPSSAVDIYTDAAASSLTGGRIQSVTAGQEAVSSINNVIAENPQALNAEALT